MGACGPSTGETATSAAGQSFASTLQSSYGQNFGAESSILGNLTNTLTPIAEAGPNQEGFSAAEKANLNSTAASSNATNYKNASAAVSEGRAGAGGNTYAPSGADTAVQAGLASEESSNLSNQQSAIEQADYTQGNKNFENAESGLEGVASTYNANGTGSLALQGNQNAFSEASQENQESNAWMGDVAGLAGGLGGAAITAFAPAKKPCWIAAEVYGGWLDPRTILVRDWLLNTWTKTLLGAAIVRLYVLVGKQTAWIIHRVPMLRKPFKALFDIALRKAGK